VIWALVDCALAVSAMLNSNNNVESNAAFFNLESPFGIAIFKGMLSSAAVFVLGLKSAWGLLGPLSLGRRCRPFALSA
jgi:hypothetical protein